MVDLTNNNNSQNKNNESLGTDQQGLGSRSGMQGQERAKTGMQEASQKTGQDSMMERGSKGNEGKTQGVGSQGYAAGSREGMQQKQGSFNPQKDNE